MTPPAPRGSGWRPSCERTHRCGGLQRSPSYMYIAVPCRAYIGTYHCCFRAWWSNHAVSLGCLVVAIPARAALDCLGLQSTSWLRCRRVQLLSSASKRCCFQTCTHTTRAPQTWSSLPSPSALRPQLMISCCTRRTLRLGRALFNAQAQQHGRPTPEHWRRVVVNYLVTGFSGRLESNPVRASARLGVPVHKPLWWCCTLACMYMKRVCFSAPKLHC